MASKSQIGVIKFTIKVLRNLEKADLNSKLTIHVVL